MNIEEIKRRTNIGIVKANKERQIRERQEKAAKLKEDRRRRARFKESLKWQCDNIYTAIQKAADNGHISYTHKICGDSELVKAVTIKFKDEGFTVTEKSEYIDAERGDPDSGEGRHDAYTEYTLRFSW